MQLTRYSDAASHSHTNPTASTISLTATRVPATPAADRTFGTVELVEAIFAEVPLEDLLIAMRTCKSFCVIIKTSKAVMKDKFWLSLDMPADDVEDDAESHEIEHHRADEVDVVMGDNKDEAGAAEVPMADEEMHGVEDSADEHATEEVEDEDEEEEEEEPDPIVPEVIVTSPFRTHTSFTIPGTKLKESFAIEMTDCDNSRGAWVSAKGSIVVSYRLSKYPHDFDTNIKIRTDSSSELWRRIPLADVRGEFEVISNAENFKHQRLRRFPGGSTLGDMYCWLIDEATSSAVSPVEQPGRGYPNARAA